MSLSFILIICLVTIIASEPDTAFKPPPFGIFNPNSTTESTLQYTESKERPAGRKTIVCGEPAVEPTESWTRIVGGKEARKHSYPWHVIIYLEGHKHCGGSLIQPNMVLTAASCAYFRGKSYRSLGLKPYDYTVRMGAHDLLNPKENTQNAYVNGILIHNNFDQSSGTNDVAIFSIEPAAKLTENVQLICIPSVDPTSSDDNCFMAGWGKTKATGDEQLLNQLKMPVLEPKHCSNHFRRGQLHQTFYCAGYLTGDKDACTYDGGNGMVCKRGDRWELAGVLSLDTDCSAVDRGTVFTNVRKLETSIDDMVKQMEDILLG